MKVQMTLALKNKASKNKNQQGITLIALVVTIIILLILAGLTINIALGQNGLFSKSKEAVEKHKEEAAREKISMVLGEYMFDINAVDMSEEDKEGHLLELLGNLGPTTATEDHYEVVVDGYVFWVDKVTHEITSKGPEKAVDLTGIKVKDTSKDIELTIGQTKLIEIEVEPEGASTRYIEYTSSDSNIVEVKNGTVKGIAEGTATITISSSKNANIKETINVTVKEVEIESISLDKETLTVGLGKTSEALKVTYNPTNATVQSVTWNTSDATKATVDSDGKITGVAETEEDKPVTITATTLNGKTATCKVTVKEEPVSKYMNINGTKKLVNTKDVYGSTVTGYACDRTDVTWQIFYIDNYTEGSEEKSRVYLIAEDFVVPPINSATVSEDKKVLRTWRPSNYPKAYCFTTEDSSKTPMLDEYIGALPNTTFEQKWLSEYQGQQVSNINLKATNYMLDQTKWAEYKGTKADYAIGNPTLPLFAASFNDVAKSSVKLGYKVGTNGYEVKQGNGQYKDGLSGFGESDMQNGIYFKGSEKGSAYGMWLASPQFDNERMIMFAGYRGEVDGTDILSDGSLGFRPIVVLNSNVQFSENSDKSYTINP